MWRLLDRDKNSKKTEGVYVVSPIFHECLSINLANDANTRYIALYEYGQKYIQINTLTL